MSERQRVRQRKRRPGVPSPRKFEQQKIERTEQTGAVRDREESVGTTDEEKSILSGFVSTINVIIGITVMVIAAYKYTDFLQTIHENNMWFTNIKEVEREISFRTESGLYYSYYKQLVSAPSLARGLVDLMHDNQTEHLNTINILARFNVYQEVALAAIYRTFPIIQHSLQPILFYTYSIFRLQAVVVCSLYVMAWLMSGTWLAGLLAAFLYIANRTDTTRVDFVVPLRESFSLPCLWAQVACVSCYFRPHVAGWRKTASVIGIFWWTFLFALTWQFNQFVLLLQAMALFGVQVLQLVPHSKIRMVYMAEAVSLLAVCVLQFVNTMIIGSFALSFIPAALLVMRIQSEGPVRGSTCAKVTKTLAYIVLVFLIAFPLNAVIKFLIKQEADEHIYKFLLAKFKLGNSRDFDANLYLCNGAFVFLGQDTFERLTQNFVFPIYVLVHSTLLLLLAVAVAQKWRFENNKGEKKHSSHMYSSCPDLAYHTIQCTFFGVLALTTLRMKYLWTPYMCVLAGVGLGNCQFWYWLTGKLGQLGKVKAQIYMHTVLVVTLAAVVYRCLPPILAELEVLREFYDPDTVQLMEWIRDKTPAGTALAGSMQLLAAVKLCTGHPVTNHPHYEDQGLRHRTKALYQMYARRDPEEVHTIMKQYNASYIILEDSICLSRQKDGCRLPDILDLDNGMVPDFQKEEPGLVRSDTPRFCDQIRHQSPKYASLFKAVFTNKTFRVYKVL